MIRPTQACQDPYLRPRLANCGWNAYAPATVHPWLAPPEQVAAPGHALETPNRHSSIMQQPSTILDHPLVSSRYFSHGAKHSLILIGSMPPTGASWRARTMALLTRRR